MKLKRGMVIVFCPILCRTIGNEGSFDAVSIGIVLGYDRDADCYDIHIGSSNLFASITSVRATRDNLTILAPHI